MPSRVALSAVAVVTLLGGDARAAEPELPRYLPRGFGVNVTASLGGIGYVGPLRSIVGIGGLFSVEGGYDVARFAALFVRVEGAAHPTVAAPPPPPTALQAYYGLVGGRLSLALGAGIRIFGAGFAGFGIVSSDVLATYAVPNATSPGFVVGADGGIEILVALRHYSFGLAGGYRLVATLGDAAAHATGYLRYTF